MRKIVVLIVSLVVIMSTLGVTAFAAPSTYFMISNLTAPKAEAGKTFDLTVGFEAVQVPGSVSLTVSGDVFTLDGNLTDVVVDMNSTTETATVKVKVDEGVFEGRYPLTVTATYTPKEGETYPVTKSRTINIDVAGEKYNPPVTETASISVVSLPSYSYVLPNSTVNIPIGLSVTPGTGSATVSVTSDNFVLASAKTLSMNGNGTYTWNIAVRCLDSVKAGNYPLKIDISYVSGNGATASCSETVYITVGEINLPEVGDPSVTLDVTAAPETAVNAGDTFDVGFTSFVNNAYNYYGITYAQRGAVTVSGNGFTLAGALAEEEISSGSSSVSILADPTLTTGRYPVTLTVTYEIDGKEYSDSKILNIDVAGKEEESGEEEVKSASFRLTSASIPQKRGRSNLSTTLSLEFVNTTDYPAENVKIKLTGLGDIILDTYTDTVDGGVVNGGQTVSASFPIKFPEFPKAQTTLTVELSYDTDEGPKSEPFNVYLQATENKQEQETPESASLTPKVIVSSYGVDVDNVTSGAEFTFSFVLKNTSTEKDLKNMTVNVTPQGYTSSTGGTSSGPVFSFIDGTSSFYTDVLEKDSELEYSIRLKCSASAGAGSYPINISFSFEYANNGGYSASTGDMDINLPVSQPIKFELLEWTPPTECPQSGVPLSFQYYNKSRNPMTSLVISAEGDFEMPVQTIGTLSASSYDFFNGTVTPSADLSVGDTGTCTLVFTFEDAAGEEQRIEETFEMTVTEGSADGMMGGMDGMGGFGGMDGDITVDYGGGVDPGFNPDGTVPADGDMVDGEGAGLPLWAKIAIPCGAALIVIIIVVVVVKKVKAKKELDEDDDD